MIGLHDLFSFLSTILAPPGPPKNVSVRSVGKDNLTLDWQVPDSDGGSRIKKYHIEKDKSGKENWEKVFFIFPIILRNIIIYIIWLNYYLE